MLGGFAIGHRVGVFDAADRKFAATLKFGHCPDETTELVFVRPLQRLVWFEHCPPADIVKITACLVFTLWRPSVYDFAWRVDGWTLFEVVTDDDETGAPTILQRLELLESGVALRMTLVLPIVTLTDVEWVVVADSAWLLCGHVC